MDQRVFITHSTKDQEVSSTICSALERRGLACWISSRDVRPGQNFQEQIVKAIRAAKVMVLIFTANANNSNEIKKELALASQNNLIVIPVRVEDVSPNEAIAYEFATRQWIDLFGNWENSIARLVDHIASVIEDGPSSSPAISTSEETTTTKPAVARSSSVRRPGLRWAAISGVAAICAAIVLWVAMVPRRQAAAPIQSPVQMAASAPSQPVAVAPAQPPDQEAAFWESIKDSKDAADFQAYLKRYAEGAFADLARNRLALLLPKLAPAPAASSKPTIRVTSATYGSNCGIPSGNATEILAKACNDQVSCDYVISFKVIGDPKRGCHKDFLAQWQCAESLRSAKVNGEAGFGSVIHLSCE